MIQLEAEAPRIERYGASDVLDLISHAPEPEDEALLPHVDWPDAPLPLCEDCKEEEDELGLDE